MYKNNLDSHMSKLKNSSKTHLEKQLPVIIKLDGKAFKIFTKYLNKPFDNIIAITMQDTMTYLCEHITNCVIGYTQSDEITLVLCNYKKPTSQAWMNNSVQKICAVASSMATMAFNKFFRENVEELESETCGTCDLDVINLIKRYNECMDNGAMFDCCAFNIPRDEVNDCFVWRQNDAIKTSIRTIAQSEFSYKRLSNKTEEQMREMLREERNIDWHEFPHYLKYGSCCLQIEEPFVNPNGENCIRHKWLVDSKIPIFAENTEYVNERINFD